MNGIIRKSERSRTLTLDDFDRAVTYIHDKNVRMWEAYDDRNRDEYFLACGYESAVLDLWEQLQIEEDDER